jgi:HSP20 family protein
MDIQRFTPWRHRNTDNKLAKRGDEAHPLSSLQQAMNSLFDNFWQDFGSFPATPTFAAGMFNPNMDVSEREGHYVITAELPGLSEKDLDISLHNGVLTLRGEKKEEHDERSKGRYLMERTYGAFHRSVTLPGDAVEDGIDATFKNGVLTVQVPRSKEPPPGSRKIDVKTG